MEGGCGNSSERNYLVGSNSLDQIRRRIEAIKKMKKPNVKWTLITGVIIIGLAAVGLTNSIGSTQNTPNSNSENPQGSTLIQGLNNTDTTITTTQNPEI